MNPTILRRLYDNAKQVSAEDPAVTLPELLKRLEKAVWTELKNPPEGNHTARQPMISSLRRSLQQKHLQRLIDLALLDRKSPTAYRTIANVARMRMRRLKQQMEDIPKEEIDSYTRAHLANAKAKISKTLDAAFIQRGE